MTANVPLCFKVDLCMIMYRSCCRGKRFRESNDGMGRQFGYKQIRQIFEDPHVRIPCLYYSIVSAMPFWRAKNHERWLPTHVVGATNQVAVLGATNIDQILTKEHKT